MKADKVGFSAKPEGPLNQDQKVVSAALAVNPEGKLSLSLTAHPAAEGPN